MPTGQEARRHATGARHFHAGPLRNLKISDGTVSSMWGAGRRSSIQGGDCFAMCRERSEAVRETAGARP
jgi:hypothetical protein